MPVSTQMAHIPRFLLPQLTWTSKAVQTSSALAIRPSTFLTATGREYHTSQPQQQSIASQARAWRTTGMKNSTALSARHRHTNTLPTHINARSPCTQPHRPFSTTPRLPRDHHFDTLKFVQRLKDEGFSEPQAVATMKVLSDVIEESIQNLTRTMVLREDAEKSTYTQKVDFSKLRSELLSADSTESSLTRASHERLTNDLAKLNSRLRDEIARTQASVRLDLNLEKGRIREEANVQELKIKETETRIEQEVAGLRERVEGVKFSTLQWLMGVCTGTAALILGAWRLLM
ncbi:MAG: hypothetical protein M1830_005613 [Pleopsidium flavum]|nr:MAG: hypothetical protein M1830_005613 [Pleopsidium flavum]